MCKSQAEGGRRCAFHATQAASAALVTTAAAETGLSHREAAAAFADLQAEGRHLPAPSRAEVDEWLAAQEFRARWSPVLSDHKRASVASRLRAALGRAAPDGATWHAWRSCLAECWARTRRKVAAVFVAGSLVTGLGACGTTDSPARDATPDRPAATASASPTATSTVVEPPHVEQGVFTGEPVEVFGRERVESGYATVAAFAGEGFNAGLIAGTPQAVEFEGLTTRMTPSAAADYRATVQRALAGDRVASSALMTAATFDVRGDGFTLATEGALVTNHRVSAPSVAVDRTTGAARLQVTVHQHGDLRGTLNGTRVLVPMNKDVTYWLVPTSSGWLVDGWSGTWGFGEAQPEH
jgi:hypothetical protein